MSVFVRVSTIFPSNISGWPINLSKYLSQPFCLSVCLSLSLSLSLSHSIYLSIYLSIALLPSFSISLYLSLSLYIYIYIYRYIYIYIYICIYIYIYREREIHAYARVYMCIFTNPSTTSRMWHKVYFHAMFNRFKFKDFLLLHQLLY